MASPTVPPGFFTTLEVARMLGVSQTSVVRWIDCGLLYADRRHGGAGWRFVSRETLRLFAADNCLRVNWRLVGVVGLTGGGEAGDTLPTATTQGGENHQTQEDGKDAASTTRHVGGVEGDVVSAADHGKRDRERNEPRCRRDAQSSQPQSPHSPDHFNGKAEGV